MIGRRKPLYAKVGVFGVGHAVYWDQFPGLYEKLMEGIPDTSSSNVYWAIDEIFKKDEKQSV